MNRGIGPIMEESRMNQSMKLAYAVTTVVGAVALGSALISARAQAQAVAAKPVGVTAAQGMNCGGESALRIEVDRPHDLQVSMSRPAGASGWNTMIMATARVATLDRSRPCGGPIRVQVTAEEPDARSALQTCAIMGASVGSGQKLVLSMRTTEAARSGAGGALLVSKPVQIECGVE